MSITYEEISGLDDLFYDVTLTNESTGAALTTGTVSVALCTHGTTSQLASGCTQSLTHVAAGRWTGTHDFSSFAAALPTAGKLFDKVLVVSGMATRRLSICKRVAIVDESDA